MSTEIGDTDYIVKLIDECRKMNLKVLPPNVNESQVGFVVTLDGIRFGLSAIKNVGVNAVESIISMKNKDGNFENIFDFCKRVDLRLVNKKTLEGLIQAGAFDSLGGHRAQMFSCVEKAIQYGGQAQGFQSVGQSTLFESDSILSKTHHYPPMPDAASWSESEKLTREKSVLGFYVSGHPLLKYEMEVEAFSTASLGNPSVVKSGSTVRVCGIVSSIKTKFDKKGNKMAFVTIEDFSGKGEGIVFSKVYQQCLSSPVEEAMIMIIGSAEQNGDSLRILVNEIYPME